MKHVGSEENVGGLLNMNIERVKPKEGRDVLYFSMSKVFGKPMNSTN